MTDNDTDSDVSQQSPADDSEQPDDESGLEQRVEDLEQEVGDIDIQDFESQLRSIRTQQERLEEQFDALAKRTRAESELTPHIDSVKALYLSLEEVESDIIRLQERLVDLTEKVGSGDESEVESGTEFESESESE
jgi:predicted  nucleic acid-binding Zn-ribbon protein